MDDREVLLQRFMRCGRIYFLFFISLSLFSITKLAATVPLQCHLRSLTLCLHLFFVFCVCASESEWVCVCWCVCACASAIERRREQQSLIFRRLRRTSYITWITYRYRSRGEGFTRLHTQTDRSWRWWKKIQHCFLYLSQMMTPDLKVYSRCVKTSPRCFNFKHLNDVWKFKHLGEVFCVTSKERK